MWEAMFSSPAVWFTIPALIGTGLFALKLFLMLIGSDLDTDVGDLSAVDHGGAADVGFKLLSIQSVLAFLMGFGWAGLAAVTATEWKMPLVSAAAVAGGLGMTYFMGVLMASVFKLQASGNVDIRSTIGAEGTVYVTIPGENKGPGQVTLVVSERQRVYSAVSMGGELARNTRVRVVGIHGQNTLEVVPA